MPQLSLHTPIGDLTISEENGSIVALDWGWGRDQDETLLLGQVRDRLQDYFDGLSVDFTDLPLEPFGTPYRRKVWQALRAVLRGQTCTYAELARSAGGVARSIGQANAANPIPILIPCHRVLAAGGLGGYSGKGGLATKRLLLDLERPLSNPPQFGIGRAA